MNTYFHRVAKLSPTKFWINNVTRQQAKFAIDAGAVGCTQNPAYGWKMLSHDQEAEYAKNILQRILEKENDIDMVLSSFQRELIKEIAQKFLPIYESSNGKFGFVSIQGNPFCEDTDSIIEFARFNREASPNVIAKIPVIKDGIEAIEILASERIPILATEIMSVRQVIDVCEAYLRGIKGLNYPAPLYYAHIAGIFDEYLMKEVESKNIVISPDILWQAGISVAKKIYQVVKERKYPAKYTGGGARGLHHFTEMVGADAAITINWAGTADKLIEINPPVVQRFLRPTPFSVIEELIYKLPDFRRAYFIEEIEPEEYENFGPVVLFRSSFEKAWQNARSYLELKG